jgi:UDP-N-acetyl-D-mannosaminuronate dehydrogenase
VQKQDCVAILTDHDGINYEMLVQHAQKIFDARHAIPDSISGNKENIVYL